MTKKEMKKTLMELREEAEKEDNVKRAPGIYFAIGYIAAAEFGENCNKVLEELRKEVK